MFGNFLFNCILEFSKIFLSLLRKQESKRKIIQTFSFFRFVFMAETELKNTLCVGYFVSAFQNFLGHRNRQQSVTRAGRWRKFKFFSPRCHWCGWWKAEFFPLHSWVSGRFFVASCTGSCTFPPGSAGDKCTAQGFCHSPGNPWGQHTPGEQRGKI